MSGIILKVNQDSSTKSKLVLEGDSEHPIEVWGRSIDGRNSATLGINELVFEFINIAGGSNFYNTSFILSGLYRSPSTLIGRHVTFDFKLIFYMKGPKNPTDPKDPSDPVILSGVSIGLPIQFNEFDTRRFHSNSIPPLLEYYFKTHSNSAETILKGRIDRVELVPTLLEV